MKREYSTDKWIYNEKEWDTVGKKDRYICPECEYLGQTCDRCGGNEDGLYE